MFHPGKVNYKEACFKEQSSGKHLRLKHLSVGRLVLARWKFSGCGSMSPRRTAVGETAACAASAGKFLSGKEFSRDAIWKPALHIGVNQITLLYFSGGFRLQQFHKGKRSEPRMSKNWLHAGGSGCIRAWACSLAGTGFF